MSLHPWKEEFYPVPADDPSIKTNLQAVQHSLQKWRGLRPDVLVAYGVMVTPRGHLQADTTYLGIDSDSCALCIRHDDGRRPGACQTCPLSRERSGKRCDERRRDELLSSPWRLWVADHNPEDMIRWLEKAEATLLKDQQRGKVVD